MGQTVKGMDKVLKSMDVEKIGKVMDKFEENFETLDVRTAYMDSAIDQTTAGATPQEEVSELLAQVADEHGLQLSAEIGEAPTKTPAASSAVAEKPDDLEARFAALNN